MPQAAAPQTARVPDRDETVPIEQLIEDVAPDPNWQDTPNPVLGDRRPMDLIGTPYEPALRDLLRAAKHGMVS